MGIFDKLIYGVKNVKRVNDYNELYTFPHKALFVWDVVEMETEKEINSIYEKMKSASDIKIFVHERVVEGTCFIENLGNIKFNLYRDNCGVYTQFSFGVYKTQYRYDIYGTDKLISVPKFYEFLRMTFGKAISDFNKEIGLI